MRNTKITAAFFLFALGGVVPGKLSAQVEYAVMVREAGTKKTFYGGGTTSRDSHQTRLFAVSRIDFSNSFARTFTLRGICHVKKSGRATVFSPFSNTDPEYTGTSHLVNAGKSGLMDMMVVTADDPNETVWYFPQGKRDNLEHRRCQSAHGSACNLAFCLFS